MAGVVYDPVREDEFTATTDGAWCNGAPIRSAGAARDREAMLLCSYPSPLDLEVDGEESCAATGGWWTPSRPCAGPAAPRSTWRTSRLGWADAVYGTRAQPWDVAAGALLVHRAGGVYLGDPLAPPATTSRTWAASTSPRPPSRRWPWRSGRRIVPGVRGRAPGAGGRPGS
ncbi:inositol monophosphatase family protein [Nonomuraea ferruginea]